MYNITAQDFWRNKLIENLDNFIECESSIDSLLYFKQLIINLVNTYDINRVCNRYLEDDVDINNIEIFYNSIMRKITLEYYSYINCK